MKVKYTLSEDADPPVYATDGAAGMDIRSRENVYLFSGDYAVVCTGLHLEIPKGYEAQVRPRSGLAFNNGITVLNAPGTIDSDYRGEVKVILVNHGKTTHVIKKGDRVAQLVFAKVERVELVQEGDLGETRRGKRGFGSTGTL